MTLRGPRADVLLNEFMSSEISRACCDLSCAGDGDRFLCSIKL